MGPFGAWTSLCEGAAVRGAPQRIVGASRIDRRGVGVGVCMREERRPRIGGNVRAPGRSVGVRPLAKAPRAVPLVGEEGVEVAREPLVEQREESEAMSAAATAGRSGAPPLMRQRFVLDFDAIVEASRFASSFHTPDGGSMRRSLLPSPWAIDGLHFTCLWVFEEGRIGAVKIDLPQPPPPGAGPLPQPGWKCFIEPQRASACPLLSVPRSREQGRIAVAPSNAASGTAPFGLTVILTLVQKLIIFALANKLLFHIVVLYPPPSFFFLNCRSVLHSAPSEVAPTVCRLFTFIHAVFIVAVLQPHYHPNASLFFFLETR